MGRKQATIGSFMHIAAFVSITGAGVFTAEDHVTIGPGSRVFTGTDDYVGNSLANSTIPPPFRNVTRSYVTLLSHSRLGANTVILPGITVGEGALVEPSSVVISDLAPWSINSGAPCRQTGDRSRADVIEVEKELIRKGLKMKDEQCPCALIGANVMLYPLAKILSPDVVSIGDNVIIDDFVLIDGGSAAEIGSYVHIACFTSVTGGGRFVMKDFTTISSGCRILTGAGEVTAPAVRDSSPPEVSGDADRSFVILEKHSILGANVVVLPGVTVGEGAAVGAGSLVVTDVEPWTVNVGSPSRPIKARPSEKILRMERELLEGN
jgi:galactoside O-acetyltransferase